VEYRNTTHRPTDTFDQLNLDNMERIAAYLVDLVQALDTSSIHVDEFSDLQRVEGQSLRWVIGLPIPAEERIVNQTISALLGMPAL
jgi:hypothetical protein